MLFLFLAAVNRTSGHTHTQRGAYKVHFKKRVEKLSLYDMFKMLQVTKAKPKKVDTTSQLLIQFENV